MSYKIVFDGPSVKRYSREEYYHQYGSSPDIADRIYKFFLRFSNEASELHVCLYLFNNNHIADALVELAKKGVSIFITTIPLEGYTNRVVTVSDEKGYRRTSKYLEAKKVHQRLLNTPNVSLKYFNHIFVRSANFKNFSRGALPYSLHIKSILLVTNKCQYKLLTSSNLAVGDELKDELLLIERIPKDDKSNLIFFYHIHELATSFPVLKNKLDFYYPDKVYDPFNNRIFTSPFYKDSNSKVDRDIKNLIRSAKTRLIICAQHVTNFASDISVALRRNEKLLVTIITQTYAGDSHIYEKVRHPKNENDFRNFSKAISKSNISYFVNDSVHHKFIVVDDMSIISTANYTNTQAIWKYINIASFNFSSERSYCGVFSEVNEYRFLNCRVAANKLADHAKTITLRENTYRV